MVEVETETAKIGAGVKSREIEEKIINFILWLRKEGYKENTIRNWTYSIERLVRLGADITDPEDVKAVIAKQGWPDNYKKVYITAYSAFLRMLGKEWKPPKCNYTQKLPFIPTEEELDTLIAACGKKLATFLRTLKETGARSGETIQLKWIDIDNRNNTITINQPEKGGNPRIIKVSSKLIAMLNDLPHTEQRVFGSTLLNYVRRNFTAQRKRIARKLKNPRLMKIHFHTFRHWKATMEYHKTKDILHVKQLLGHKNINNTMLYTQLIHFEGDEYHVKVAKTLEEVKKLLAAGFDYVKDHDGFSVFRKRK